MKSLLFMSCSYNACKLGVALENRAIEMYKKFIMESWDEPVLRDALMDFLVDEEFHTLWLDDYAKEPQ